MPIALAQTLKTLWVPVLLLALFALGELLAPGLLRDMGMNTVADLRYLAQIGLWLSGAFLAVRLLDLLFWQRFVGQVLQRSVPRLLKDSLALIIYLLAIAGIVDGVFGHSIVGIWAASGAIGIVLGLALRPIILDIFTGLAVNFDGSCRIGDWVELIDRRLPPSRGKIVEINWRTTRVETLDDRIMVIPNSRFGEMIMVNLSLPDDCCRFMFRLTLDHEVPTPRALRVLSAGVQAACGGDGPLADPAPKVIVFGTSDLGIEYNIGFSARLASITELEARNRVLQSVLRHLAKAGLSLAHQKQSLFLSKESGHQLDHYSVPDRLGFLRPLEIFRGIREQALADLAAAMQVRVFAAGEALIQQDEQGQSMFVLAEGLCDVLRVDAEVLVKIGVIEPGEIVGEMSLVTGEPRSATVIAATETVGYELSAEELAPLLEQHAELDEEISRLVAARRLQTEQRLAELGPEQQATEVRRLSLQILERMRAFFRTLLRRRPILPPAAGARPNAPATASFEPARPQ